MKIETLQDVLTVDFDKMKSMDKTRLLYRIKELIKETDIESKHLDEDSQDYKYTALSIVDKKLVRLSFDLESKKARVVDTETNPVDRKSNYMVGAKAIQEMKTLIKTQKEIVNEKSK